jgi:hypothetical protein
MTISGVLMGLVRYLPTLKVQQSFPSDVGNQAGINFYNLNYLIFPYVGDSLPWQDLTLRSLYIGSIVLPLIFFFQRKNTYTFRWILITVFSVFMMTFNALNSILREFLPLADVSRFAITDWRNTFNLSIIILSVLILNNLIDKDIDLKILRSILFFGFLGYIIFAGYGIGHTVFSLIIYSVFSILTFIIIVYHRLFSAYFKFLIVIMACIFGIFFVFQNKFSWMTTVKEQNFNIYNNTFTNVFTNEVISVKANNIISKVLLSYDNIYSITNYDNLIDLEDITQPSIFTTLKMRFIENKEYTFIGNDMVFINSYNKTRCSRGDNV